MNGRRLLREWTVVNDSPLAVRRAVLPEKLGDSQAIARRAVASGQAWVAVAKFEGHNVIRMCVTRDESGEDEICELAEALHGP